MECYLCWYQKDASIFYINKTKLKFSFFDINTSLHFFDRSTNPPLPYTVRLISLNLLFPLLYEIHFTTQI